MSASAPVAERRRRKPPRSPSGARTTRAPAGWPRCCSRRRCWCSASSSGCRSWRRCASRCTTSGGSTRQASSSRAPTFVGPGQLHGDLLRRTGDRFWNAFWNTSFFTVTSVLLETVIGLAMALIMHQAFRGRAMVRASILVPWAIPTAISALLWRWIFQTDGIANSLINTQVLWTTEGLQAQLAVIIAEVWKTAPFVGLLTLAGLQTIPEEVYEAARVDGAGLVGVLEHHAAAGQARTAGGGPVPSARRDADVRPALHPHRPGQGVGRDPVHARLRRSRQRGSGPPPRTRSCSSSTSPSSRSCSSSCSAPTCSVTAERKAEEAARNGRGRSKQEGRSGDPAPTHRRRDQGRRLMAVA